MSDEEQGAGKGFKFKDNRRFDSEGNDRIDAKPVRMNKPEDTPAAFTMADSKLVSPEQTGAASGEYEIDFSSFVVSLATQVLMQLGAMESPEGMQVPVDKEAAKQTIEILAMLKAKTKGNLETAEEHLLEEILHNLRLHFVKTGSK